MDAPWVAPFLKAIARGSTTAEAAQHAGITTGTAYSRRVKDADFAEAWAQALEDSTDVLEAEARRRAIDGVEEPVVYKGQLTPVWEYAADGQVITIGEGPNARLVQARNPDGSLKWLTIRKPSDALLALLLKGRRKEFATERTELTGANGAPVEIDATTRAARVAALLQAAKERSNIA